MSEKTAPHGSAGRAGGGAPRWRGGWLARWPGGVRRIESPNRGARPDGAAVTLVVLHSISLPPGVYGGDAVERLFTNRLDWDAHPYFARIRGTAVSAHFVLRRDGALEQYVSCDERAWHAGASSWRGRADCNDYSIGIELEGLEGEAFDDAQYASLAPLLAALARRYPIEAVAGHEHVAPGRKNDPGAGFDWERLTRETGWPRPSPSTGRDEARNDCTDGGAPSRVHPGKR